MIEKIFARRLRNILKQKNLTQTDLSKKTGLTMSAISHYVNAVQCPHSTALVLIADALNVGTDYLLGRTDETEDTFAIIKEQEKTIKALEDKNKKLTLWLNTCLKKERENHD